VYFNLRNILPKSGIFPQGHPVYKKVNVYLSSLMMKVPDHVCLRLDLYMSHVK
jgi:hypothetical protein